MNEKYFTVMHGLPLKRTRIHPFLNCLKERQKNLSILATFLRKLWNLNLFKCSSNTRSKISSMIRTNCTRCVYKPTISLCAHLPRAVLGRRCHGEDGRISVLSHTEVRKLRLETLEATWNEQVKFLNFSSQIPNLRVSCIRTDTSFNYISCFLYKPT